MDVTVAICTWNRSGLLEETLTRMAALRVPAKLSWELLVVDNNSTDATADVLSRRIATGTLPLRTVFEARQGHSNARNRALEEARGDVILWTDDDVDFDPEWLAAGADMFARHPDAAAVGGPILPWFPTEPDPDMLAVFELLRIGYCGVDHGPIERDLAPGEWIYGANMAYRRTLTQGLRFDPRSGRVGTNLNSGDDIGFVQAVRERGGRVMWCPAMRLRHYVEPARMTLAYQERFYKDTARTTVLNASPDPSPTLFGLPRWLLRHYATTVVRSWLACLRGRQARFAALKEKWVAAGRLQGYRERTRHAAPPPGGA